jgi:cyclopropane-fatty-acyl-phospholipid synthase
MLWGAKAPPYERVSVTADRDSSEYMLAVIEKVFLDGCFPFSVEQLQDDAGPYFTLVSHHNGRLDYIHTIEEWRRQLRHVNLTMIRAYAKQLWHTFGDADLRYKFELLRRPYFAECFRQEVIDHERMVFGRQ